MHLIQQASHNLMEEEKGINILQEFERKNNWFILISFIIK